jgi:hypothetical protein
MKRSKGNWLTRAMILGLIFGAFIFFACNSGGDDKPKTGAGDSSYNVNVASTPNGTIAVNPAKGAVGTEITVTVNPSAGYRLKEGSVKYNAGGNSADVAIAKSGTVYKFNLPAANVTVKAEFESVPANNYTVSIAQLANGTITANPQYGAVDTEITLTVNANQGYYLKEGSLKYNAGGNSADVTIAKSGNAYKFNLPAANVTVKAEFENATDAKTLIDKGVDALIDGDIDGAVSHFEAAYSGFPTNEQAIVYSSLAKLASIPVSTEFYNLVSNRLGVIGYPGTINSLISGDWLHSYYKIVESYYDETIKRWVDWYDVNAGWTTASGYYYYDSNEYKLKLVTSTPRYEEGGKFLGFSTPDWLKDKDVYKDNLAIVGGQTVYTNALQFPLLYANLLDKNTNGLNDLLDDIVTDVFGSNLDQIEARIADLSDKTAVIDGKITKALGIDELLEGENIYIGKAEISIILASMRIVKASLEFLQAYDWSTDVSFITKTAWDDTLLDNLPASSLPLKSNFLKTRNNGSSLNAAKADYTKAIRATTAAYDAIIGGNNRYPQAAVDQIKQFEWIKDGLVNLETAINNGAVFYVKESSGSTYTNTAAGSLFSVNMGKLFNVGQLSLDNLLITESPTVPQFYGYKGGNETAITAKSQISGCDSIGFKIKLDKVKEVVGGIIPNDVNELSFVIIDDTEIAEKLYDKYHQ